MPAPDAAWSIVTAIALPLDCTLRPLGLRDFRESPPRPAIPSSILRI